MARSSHFSGDIQCHEMAFCGGELWIVNTLFSCLCTLGPRYSFVPRWQPPFITGLAAEDRCHLNGLAIEDREPRYVTALGETDAPRGWREGKASGGCLIEIASGSSVARGFCMPHSPRVYGGQVFLLNSGTGALVRSTARVASSTSLPGSPDTSVGYRSITTLRSSDCQRSAKRRPLAAFLWPSGVTS